MKGRIKAPLLRGNEGLGSCSKLFEALAKWQWKLPSSLIVSVGHENNWKWLKVPGSRTKFLSRKLIQLSIRIIFSKRLFFSLVTIEFLPSQMDTVLQESISFSIIPACSIVMMLRKWHILVFWIFSGVIDMFYFLIWVPYINTNFIIQSFHDFSPLFLSPPTPLEK